MLAPREHGAYGQLLFPLASALLIGRPAAGAYLLAASAVAEVKSPGPAVVVGDSRRLRILSVDDDPGVGSSLIRLLRFDGHYVAAVLTGEEALERLAIESFDVILADLGLGSGIDGWELARQVRAAWPAVKFVLTSGSLVNPVEARSRGVDALLAKPCRSKDLRALLEQTVPFAPGHAAA